MKTLNELKKGCGKKFWRNVDFDRWNYVSIPLICGVDNFCEECWKKYDPEDKFDNFDDFKKEIGEEVDGI